MITQAEQWTKDFYGGKIPSSQVGMSSVEVTKLATTLARDLAHSFNGITEDEKIEGVSAILVSMRQLGASHPKVYFEQEALSIKAYQAGIQKINTLRELENRRKEQAEIESGKAEKSEIRSPIRNKVMNTFDKYKKEFIEADEEEPALMAWFKLVDNHFDSLVELGGYAFYLVHFKIPNDNDIYDHDELIAKTNSLPKHFSFKHERKKSRLRINSKKWDGKAR